MKQVDRLMEIGRLVPVTLPVPPRPLALAESLRVRSPRTPCTGPLPKPKQAAQGKGVSR